MRPRIRLFIPLVTLLAFCIVTSNSRSAMTESYTTQHSSGMSRSSVSNEYGGDPLCGSHVAQRRDAKAMLGAMMGEAFDSTAHARLVGSKVGGAKVFAFGEKIETIEATLEAGEPFIAGLPADDPVPEMLRLLRPAAVTHDVEVGPASEFIFEPSVLTINVGDTVRWTWRSFGHTVTSGPNCTADNQYCSPNNTSCPAAPTSGTGFVYTHTFNTAGTFQYYCRVHCSSSMQGTITVQGTAATFTISGKVTTNGTTGVSGVTMTLSGSQTGTTTTDAGGNYSFANLANGNYTVTPSKAGNTFTPANRSYTSLSANQANQNFTAATASGFSISGQVKVGTTGLSGVTMTLSGAQAATTTTNASGNYSFTNLANGNYTVTPSHVNYTFTPVSRSYTNLSANQVNQNFTATPKLYSISGQVKVGTTGLSGVTMTLTSPVPAGFAPRTVMTNGTGNYTFTNVPAARNYTLTPTKSGFTFKNTSNAAQSSRTYTNLSANQVNQNFAATAVATGFTISGFVRVGSTGLSGVTMKLVSTTAGFTPRTLMTTSNGSFSFTNVPGGRNYTLTPTKVNYTFKNTSNTAQAFRSYTNLSANQTNQNFAATLKNYTISGRVLQEGTTTGIGSVTMTLTSPTPAGFTPRTLMTNSTGGYSFANVPAARNYTLKPTKTGFTFTPVSRSYTNLSANQTGAATSFTGTQTPAAPVGFEFDSPSYVAGEGDGHVEITVTRSGDVSSPASVDYSVDDDSASERSDYSTTLGTLRFAAGEMTKSFTILLTDDAYIEDDETADLKLQNATAEALNGIRDKAVLTIKDNDKTASSTNPIDDTAFFVRQLYVDFLAREPEGEELFGLVNSLNACGVGDPACDRAEMAARLLRSEEFQQRGFFVYRLYAATLRRLPSYREFIRGLRQIEGSIQEERTASRDAFLDDWVNRPEFREMYDALSDRDYVASLLHRAGMDATGGAAIASRLESGDWTRARALRDVIERTQFPETTDEAAALAMLYFAHMRRGPDDEGFKNLTEVMRQNPQAFSKAAHALIMSVEYRTRFGQP